MKSLITNERLPKNARCWLPVCGREVTFVLYQKLYGEIIGFCSEHRPVLRVRTYSDLEVEEMDTVVDN